MKVKCINNRDFEYRLTEGVEYKVIKDNKDTYLIRDNIGEEFEYFKSRFHNMNEYYGGNYTSIKPNYYNDTEITPLEYIKVNKLDFCEGNVIKYITRHRKKNGKEDLIKAKTYIEELIKEYDK